MILVNGFEKEFEYDLNDHPQDSHRLSVISTGDNDKIIPWGIMFVSNEQVCVEKNGNYLILELDYINLSTEVFIILKNSKKEQIKIRIMPNNEATCEKIYTFKITDIKTDGFNIKFNIASTRNKKEIPWECIYDGKPLSYIVEPLKSNGSSEVLISLLSPTTSEMLTLFEFKQDESNNIIKLILNNKPDGIEKAD